MSKCAEWIEDILGAAKQSHSLETIQMIECCELTTIWICFVNAQEDMKNLISNEILDCILKAGCQASVGSGKYESLHITVIQDVVIIKKIVTSAAEKAKKMVGKDLN